MYWWALLVNHTVISRTQWAQGDRSAEQTNECPMPEIMDDFNDLSTLAESWNRLEGNQQAPPQSYLWTQACVESLCANAIPHMFVQRAGAESIAIAPLMRQKSALAALELLGVGTLYEPMDFLYSDEVALEALL